MKKDAEADKADQFVSRMNAKQPPPKPSQPKPGVIRTQDLPAERQGGSKVGSRFQRGAERDEARKTLESNIHEGMAFKQWGSKGKKAKDIAHGKEASIGSGKAKVPSEIKESAQGGSVARKTDTMSKRFVMNHGHGSKRKHNAEERAVERKVRGGSKKMIKNWKKEY
jgi:hypothetical protein